MTQQHPVTPPPELVKEWLREIDDNEPMYLHVAAKAAQWGADQELEACCLWLNGGSKIDYDTAALLRAARRPKSEKQQALEDLDALQADLANYGMGFKTTNIRRALEQLPGHS